LKTHEIWTVILEDNPTEWTLMTVCASLIRADEVPVAVLREGLSSERAAEYGAEKVWMLENRNDPAEMGRQLVALIRLAMPEAVMLSANPYSRIVAATAAARLRTGLAADCTGVSRRSDGLFVVTRPAMGNGLVADIICPDARPQMFTFCTANLPVQTRAHDVRAPETHRFPCPFQPDVRVRLLERNRIHDRPLTVSEIIVCGGLGIGSSEGFEVLKRLAYRLGGAVGASRAAVNAGLIPYEYQIGLTGQSVAPRLYIALGISGAIQHLVGMERSEVILAVNTDSKAPIFEHADYAVVADWRVFTEIILADHTKG
jgi:electron transfer flavoprotein alpha subunit